MQRLHKTVGPAEKPGKKLGKELEDRLGSTGGSTVTGRSERDESVNERGRPCARCEAKRAKEAEEGAEAEGKVLDESRGSEKRADPRITASGAGEERR